MTDTSWQVRDIEVAANLLDEYGDNGGGSATFVAAERLRECAIHLEAQRGRIFGLEQELTEVKAVVRELVADRPTGDWSTAPDWAEWRAANSDGVAYWFDLEPQIVRLSNTWTGYAVWMADGARAAVDRKSQPLPLGKDWRLTKEARPN